MAPTVEAGKTVQLDYKLTVDGQVVDSSEGRGPLSYVHGQGQIIPGLERELAGLHVGDAKDVTVTPEDGYGVVDPQAFVEVPRTELPKDVAPEVGMMLQGRSNDGKPFQARIAEVKDENVKLDLNHPLAGKTLSFNVKVVEISTP